MNTLSPTPEPTEVVEIGERNILLDRLFRRIDDSVKRIMLLTKLPGSCPMFFGMDCRQKAARLRELADQLEALQ